jgi:hypothetical protein
MPSRGRLSVIVVAAMLMTGVTPLLAIDLACLADHHDCSKARLTGGCCVEQGGRANQATPAASKTDIAQQVAGGTIVVSGVPPVSSGLLLHARALITAPRSSPPDLITLFGTLLL